MPLFVPNKQTKKYSTNLSTDLFGNLARVRNLDFNRPGYLSLAKKPAVFYTESQDANFETPLAILADDTDFYIVTTDNVFSIDASNSDLSIQELITGTTPGGGFQSDGCFFNGELHVSDTASVHSLASGTWAADITSGLSSSYPHPLCVSEHQQYLAVGNGPAVALYNTSYALQTTLALPSDHVVTWMRWRANLLFVGTRNIQGGEARVYLWNGSGTAAQAGYGVGSEWAMSGVVYEAAQTIVVASASGQLLKFTGGGFIPLTDNAGNEMAFPVYHMGLTWGSNAATSNLCSKISSRGMDARGSRIYINVDSSIERPNGGYPSYLQNFPGGLWVFDPKVGLYHKSGIDHAQINTVSVSSVASDTLTIASAQVFETGDPVEMASISGLTGDVQSNQIYYAIKTSSTELKLANTPQQAVAGENISIAGTPSAADMIFHVYESVGAHYTQRQGGVHAIRAITPAIFIGSEVIYGGDVEAPAGGTIGTLMSLGMGKNVGSFVTPKLQASQITDTFHELVSKFGDLNISTRKFIIKYRTKRRWGMPGRTDFDNGQITWVDSTSFTINPKLYDVYSIEAGDEVEFLDGGAAGYTAHIATGGISEDSATQWTITIDEAMPDVTAGDQSEVVFDNWTKLCTISTADDAIAAAEGFKKQAVGGEETDTKNSAKWIEFKVEIRGYTDIMDPIDFEELMLNNTPDQNYS